MNLLALILLIIVIAMIWLVEGPEAKKSKLGRNAGVVVVGPLYSVSARGTIAKTFTFRIWKGVQYCCTWFKPANPRKPKQVNIRKALAFIVNLKDLINQSNRDYHEARAKGKKFTWFNSLIEMGLDEYVKQLGTLITPTSLEIGWLEEKPNYVWYPKQ